MMRLASFVPDPVLRRIRAVRAAIGMRRAAKADVRSIFRNIYRDAAWGSEGDGYFSGLGSLDVNSRDYVAFVNRFLDEHGVSDIVDCGCGDFRVARQFDLTKRRYVGIDIVDDVIARNREVYGNANIEFRALDMIEDELPDGQLCLIRQVLQHLSNDAIQRVLARLGKFRYVIVTDAQLSGAKPCNVDINSFSGTRNDVGSSLLLEKEPFNCRLKVVLETPLAHRGDVYLRTVLIVNDRL
jgi:SAM-dependent methyltransferase